MNRFEKQGFFKRLISMLKVDFKRAFTMPTVYIMAAVCLAMPILILVMTSFMGLDGGSGMFTSVWQAIGSVGGESAGMDLTGMCNINLLYFLIVIFVCVFVSEDFKSGYAKNLFTVRAKRIDYCISKTLTGFTASVIMLLAYFIGAMIGGAIAGLSFDTGAAGVGGIIACMFAKIFFALVFVAIALTLAVTAKRRLWLSILCSLAACMLLFTMIPMITPLDSTIINVVMCLAGGAVFAVGLGAISNVILKKTDIV